jgi:hypothetical protein
MAKGRTGSMIEREPGRWRLQFAADPDLVTAGGALGFSKAVGAAGGFGGPAERLCGRRRWTLRVVP